MKDGRDCLLVVEHPRQPGWTLLSPEKPDERTDQLYRFRLPLAAKDGGTFTVTEESVSAVARPLGNIETAELTSYLREGKMNEHVKTALQHVLELQTTLQADNLRHDQCKQEVSEIDKEQERIHQAMLRLDMNSDLYKRYVTKLDQQETRIEALQAESKFLQTKQGDNQKGLMSYIADLSIG